MFSHGNAPAEIDATPIEVLVTSLAKDTFPHSLYFRLSDLERKSFTLARAGGRLPTILVAVAATMCGLRRTKRVVVI
ncbi:hypothetical protein EVAR_80130_1 [Eumeta japonica]|uniref:Uncharacterized protein n=1 Tax=Eumeta variegata TaxID=151549 RepID=A0A4C1UDS7_EUMVA|nr:hypothetical protein EVAR_80130_1 [Eumeta japonica]